jgi:hypothetical protein
MGIAIIATIAVNIVILVILLTIFLHFYNAAFECDIYPSFWCHTDWICPGFSKDNDTNVVMRDRFGRGITNKNVKGYLLAATGNLESDTTYKYGVFTNDADDANRQFIKNRPSSSDSLASAGGACGGTYIKDGKTISSACSSTTDGPLQVPETPDSDTNAFGCYCGGPKGENGITRGYCKSGAGFNMCTVSGGTVTGNCDGICQPVMDKLCNVTSFSKVIGSCTKPTS